MFVLLTVLSVLTFVSSVSASALPCNVTDCKAPACRCSSTDIPGNLKARDIPQIVLLTFDDAVTDMMHRDYYEPLRKRKNPNNCPIGLTFFTSHEYCDYRHVHNLWSQGHEIAVHSISHKPDISYWKYANLSTWTNEMAGMRDILTRFAKIPRQSIKGIRVPFLQAGGNTQFQMMANSGFEWDCSLPTQSYVAPGLWPYTLKYRSGQDCQIEPCPTDSFPNIWVFPMLDLFDKHGTPCAMLDTCIVSSANETKDLLLTNFYRSYNGNRAPFGLYVHAAWFLQDLAGTSEHWAGYQSFLDEITKKTDVYILTISQALAWVKDPKPLTQINSFAPWRTQCSPQNPSCTHKTCRLMKKDPITGGERYVTACFDNTCPNCYPWLKDTAGSICK